MCTILFKTSYNLWGLYVGPSVKATLVGVVESSGGSRLSVSVYFRCVVAG